MISWASSPKSWTHRSTAAKGGPFGWCPTQGHSFKINKQIPLWSSRYLSTSREIEWEGADGQARMSGTKETLVHRMDRTVARDAEGTFIKIPPGNSEYLNIKSSLLFCILFTCHISQSGSYPCTRTPSSSAVCRPALYPIRTTPPSLSIRL